MAFTPRTILLIGATSAIAQATARIYAQQGAIFQLVGRQEEKLRIVADDLKAQGATEAFTLAVDMNDLDSHETVLLKTQALLGDIDLTLIAYGTLSDQAACEQSVDLTLRELHTNAISIIAFLTKIAPIYEKAGRGTIAVISSVAGDRGRQSNYVYGTAKAGVSTFLSGLRGRMLKHNVHVLTIKPGFVDTPMTAHFPKKGFLWATPEQVGKGIVTAIEKGKDVVYLPWFWFWIMTIIKMIPERIFKKLKI